MAIRDLVTALLVVAIWGVNFVLIRVGLNGIPPLQLCAMRFFLVFFPWIFFVPKPQVPFKYILGYGFFYFGLQFALLFSAIYLGFPPGLSSLVLQTQVFFTMGLSALFFSDRPSARKIVGALIAFCGIALVGSQSNGEVTFGSLLLMMTAALSFAGGNIVSKAMKKTQPLPLVIWGSFCAFPMLAIASLVLEGPHSIGVAFRSLTLTSIGAVFYIVYLSTLVAFSLWSSLLNRYPPSTVAPFTLLVPVFGFCSAALFVGETFSGWKIVASCMVITGLLVGQTQTKRA